MKAQGYREQIFKKNKIKAVYEFNCDSSGNENQLLRKSFINQNGYASGSVTYKRGSNDTVYKTTFFYDYLNRMICVVNISKESWDSTIITYKTSNNYETVYKDENFTRRHITKRRKILNREITKSYKNDSLTNWKITIRGIRYKKIKYYSSTKEKSLTKNYYDKKGQLRKSLVMNKKAIINYVVNDKDTIDSKLSEIRGERVDVYLFKNKENGLREFEEHFVKDNIREYKTYKKIEYEYY